VSVKAKVVKPRDLFAKKDSPILNRAMRAIFSDLTKAPNGQVNFPFNVINELRKEIICSRIKIKGFEDDKEILRALIIKALINLRKQDERAIEIGRFAKELANLISQYTSQAKKSFQILFPLHLAEPIQESTFNALFFGKSFKLSNWPDVESLSGWGDFIDEARTHKYGSFSYGIYVPILKQLFTPLVFSADALSSEDAFHEGNAGFEILRSLLSLQTSFGIVTYQLGPPQPLAKFCPPPFYPIFDNSGRYLSMFYNLEPYDYAKTTVPQEFDNRLVSLCEGVSRMDPALRGIFMDSLLKYVGALDTFDWRNAFLNFWQILENLSLNTLEDGLKMSEVASRIKNLMGQAETAEKLIVDGLVATRNRLVHLGKFSKSGLKEVNYIKIVAERALSNFYVFAKDYHSRAGLMNYFADATIEDGVLRERIRNIERLLETRKKV